MPGKQEGLADYREVTERITEWYARFPEGRIETAMLEFTNERVVVKAEVFRSLDPNEPPSGIGHSFLWVPGTTNFTRGSELENAETSAAGRALVMAGIPAKNIASSSEVSMKSGSSDEGSLTGTPRGPYEDGGTSRPSPPSSTLSPAAVKAIRDLFPSPAAAVEGARAALVEPELSSLSQLTTEQANIVIAWVTEQHRLKQEAMPGVTG